jgi:hypothetical protein
MLHHESYETPELEQLRESYDFDEYVAQGSSELEQMLLLKHWVFENIDFRHNYAVGNLRNTVEILSMAQSGTSFHCSHFAAVYMQLAAAMGWTPRYIFARNVKKEEHATNEVWSNELRKWIFIDVTWNLHIEKGGMPLSALEIRKEWLANGGRDLVYVYGAGDGEQRYTAADFPIARNENNAWIWWPIDEVFITYTYQMAYVTRNDFFSYDDGSGANIWDQIVILLDDVNNSDQGWGFRERPAVEEMRSLYHDVNRVDVRVRQLDRSSMSLEFDAAGPYNVSPNFDAFLVRVGEEPWRPSGPSLVLEGPERDAVVQVRVRNRFGVLGPITTYQGPH